MKTLITLILSIAAISAFSQPKGIKCIYASTMQVKKSFYDIENPIVRDTIIQRTKQDRKVYSLTISDNKSLFKKEPESVDKMPLLTDTRNIYIDFNDSSRITQTEHGGKMYIIKDKANALEWEISPETEIVLGRTCYKATLKGNNKITAWFTPDVPMVCGPLGYYGLPGLVVRIKIPVYTLDLQSITETDNPQMNIPKEGELITEDAYKANANKTYKELLNSAKKVTYYE